MRDLLEDCRTRHPTQRQLVQVRCGDGITQGIIMVPLYCGNCGAQGPHIAEDARFAFYLCQKCEGFGEVAGLMAVPDEVYAEKLKQAQIEMLGCEMTSEQVLDALRDPNSMLSKLAREAPKQR